MTVYYDISEGRKGTRLDQSVIDAGRPLANLEMLTGADVLVTPYEHEFGLPIVFARLISEKINEIIPMIVVGDSAQSIAQETEIPLPAAISAIHLWKASQFGILIQRKSGQDFTSSIPKLHEILGRMFFWTPDPWLLIAANIGCDRDGKAVIDGKTTGFTYKAVTSIKMSWMFYGGSVLEISRDNLINHMIDYADRKLLEMMTNKEHFVPRKRHTRQFIVGINDPRWEWINVLMNLPGIGAKRAIELANYAGNLANALIFLADTDAVKALNRNNVARVSDSKKFRELLGFTEYDKLAQIGEFGKEEQSQNEE